MSSNPSDKVYDLSFLTKVRRKLKGLVLKGSHIYNFYYHLNDSGSIYDVKKSRLLRSESLNKYGNTCYFVQQHEISMRIKKRDYVFYVVTDVYEGSCKTCRIHKAYDLNLIKKDRQSMNMAYKDEYDVTLKLILEGVSRADVQMDRVLSDYWYEKRKLDISRD